MSNLQVAKSFAQQFAEIGRQTGQMEAKKMMAKKLLQQGLPIVVMRQITDLPVHIVEALSSDDAKH